MEIRYDLGLQYETPDYLTMREAIKQGHWAGGSHIKALTELWENNEIRDDDEKIVSLDKLIVEYRKVYG